MIIVHTPADGTVERYDVRSVRTSEASIITRLVAADLSWPQIKARAADSDPEAMRAIAFVIRKRSQPSLRLDDFDPVADELESLMDHQEIDTWAEIAAGQLAAFDGPVEAARPALAQILDQAADTDYAQAVIDRLLAGKFPAAPDESPTDSPTPGPSLSSAPSTSASSPTSSTSTGPDSTD
ncbi:MULTISPECIES: hypothetical protein [unclassified Streptomyces]|uniref:hypothetical protein n=1 Tax=unclassified Streptomyces TaxID=2593676 RepID=UPI0016607739|nr:MULTISPECIES: hypothetical protein [unclassified Streptomyces]MBD0707396.1 hypothetical protein [Streptomyces sp. CBMA291]MBD0715152.1 hypothetical protein [Streptomyces sp. CBMA370]